MKAARIATMTTVCDSFEKNSASASWLCPAQAEADRTPSQGPEALVGRTRGGTGCMQHDVTNFSETLPWPQNSSGKKRFWPAYLHVYTATNKLAERPGMPPNIPA